VAVLLRTGVLDVPGVDAVSVFAVPGEPLRIDGADALSGQLGSDLTGLAERQEHKGDAGAVLELPMSSGPLRRLVIVGTGDGGTVAWRKAGSALARRTKSDPVVALPLDAVPTDEALAALVEGLVLASYRFRAEGAEPKGSTTERYELVGTEPQLRQAVLDAALHRARATLRARDLTNTPSLVKTPSWLAARALDGAESAGLTARVRDERELAAEGFGGVVAVGMGSTRPPRLIELSYAPAGATRHVVLVGKGITFDSGGLSLKPNEGMVSMKTDMGGGAAVIATMAALRDLGVTVKVTGLVPAAENLPSGTAQRPSDVIRHYGGRTTEVLNTDAEGRLVLADALAYAVERLAPDVIVDVATLTGAAPFALGRRHAALYASTDDLAVELAAAAAEAGERVWRMPLVEDYRAAIDSRVADLANTGSNLAVSGGSITAALFLREFTGGLPWAHLDIAGPARSDSDEDEVTKGATGYGVRLLLRWLEGMR